MKKILFAAALSLLLVNCTAPEEDKYDGPYCMSGTFLNSYCDEVYDKFQNEWKKCEKQGSKNYKMDANLEYLSYICIENGKEYCIEEETFERCLESDEFTCGVNDNNEDDLGIPYQCIKALGL